MSGFWTSSIDGALPSSAFLILALLWRGGPEVGRCGGHHDGVGGRGRRDHGVAELGRGLDADDLDPRGVGERDVRGHQGHLGAAGGRRPGQGDALPARGAVAQESDGVEAFPRATGGDHDVATRQVEDVGSSTAGEHVTRQLEDLLGLGQPALAGVLAGQPPLGGLDDERAPAAQRRDVVLGGGVLPHLGVHRGDEHDRAAGGEQRVGQQVVGEAVRGLGQEVGGRRRHDHEVGVLADPDVRDLVHVVPHLGRHRLAGQRGPGGRADEPQRRRGGHDRDVVAGLGEAPEQLAGLVGRDAAADPEDHPGPVGGGGHGGGRRRRRVGHGGPTRSCPPRRPWPSRSRRPRARPRGRTPRR